MRYVCPGQEAGVLRVELHKCPECGEEVEIFSNELKVKCHKCGTMVFKEKMPTCIEWCAAARECLGEERWNQWNRNRQGVEEGRSPSLEDSFPFPSQGKGQG